MLEDLVAFLAPPGCAVCGGGCGVRRRICQRCDGALRRLQPVVSTVSGLDEVWSAAPYEGVARRVVGALKFGARLALAEEAAELIARRAPSELLVDTIVPVPPAPLRRRRRGFDPAEALAAALAKRTGLPLVPCLARSQSPRQVGRRRAERLADPPRVRTVSPAPTNALLVDDVTTTGATLGACSAALREGGAIRVAAITLAASRRPGEGLGSRPAAA
jgi:predicted amidophosphoribosyltransferase